MRSIRRNDDKVVADKEDYDVHHDKVVEEEVKADEDVGEETADEVIREEEKAGVIAAEI